MRFDDDPGLTNQVSRLFFDVSASEDAEKKDSSSLDPSRTLDGDSTLPALSTTCQGDVAAAVTRATVYSAPNLQTR